MKKFLNTEYYISEDGSVYRGGQKLNPPKYSNGYLVQKIYVNGQYKRYLVHRLVAMTYLPNPENKKFVNHINGQKEDNRLVNLEWVTSQENHTHAKLNGLKAKGETHGFSKLTNDNVILIKNMLNDKIPQRKIGKIFGVCQASIRDINNNITWGHVNTL